MNTNRGAAPYPAGERVRSPDPTITISWHALGEAPISPCQEMVAAAGAGHALRSSQGTAPAGRGSDGQCNAVRAARNASGLGFCIKKTAAGSEACGCFCEK
ncbi:MAG: hypothetical protein KAI66_20020 [Lentisphaeria bacterium]|nr:hypothetical protein [Lentisphaeria bacterium]